MAEYAGKRAYAMRPSQELLCSRPLVFMIILADV